MNLRLPIACLAMLLPALACRAQGAAKEPGWTGKGQAGLLFSQGNTEAKSANAAIDLARASDAWTHAFHLGGLYAQSADITSAQRWDAAWQSNYDLTADLFLFGALRYAADQFSGFDYQAAATTGVGYRMIDTEAVKLTGQLGAGYRQSRPELIFKDAAGAVIDRVPLESEGEAIAVAGLDYSHALNAYVSLSNKLLVEYGSSNTFTTDAFALNVKMSEKLALGVGVAVQHNSNPPAGLKKTDTVETLNLVFAF